MQPINGLRVGKFLSTRMGASGDAVRDWRVHWTEVGFDALEPQLDGPFAVGGTLSLADLCLYGQAWYTRANLGLDLGRWAKLAAIVARMDGMEAVQAALPGRQPDAGG
jgi:glutathione S-transferase